MDSEHKSHNSQAKGQATRIFQMDDLMSLDAPHLENTTICAIVFLSRFIPGNLGVRYLYQGQKTNP